MYATRYSDRPRPAIIARQRKIAKEKRTAKVQHIKTLILTVALIGCVIASGYCN